MCDMLCMYVHNAAMYTIKAFEFLFSNSNSNSNAIQISKGLIDSSQKKPPESDPIPGPVWHPYSNHCFIPSMAKGKKRGGNSNIVNSASTIFGSFRIVS